jgi:hypothetical protein
VKVCEPEPSGSNFSQLPLGVVAAKAKYGVRNIAAAIAQQHQTKTYLLLVLIKDQSAILVAEPPIFL